MATPPTRTNSEDLSPFSINEKEPNKTPSTAKSLSQVWKEYENSRGFDIDENKSSTHLRNRISTDPIVTRDRSRSILSSFSGIFGHKQESTTPPSSPFIRRKTTSDPVKQFPANTADSNKHLTYTSPVSRKFNGKDPEKGSMSRSLGEKMRATFFKSKESKEEKVDTSKIESFFSTLNQKKITISEFLLLPGTDKIVEEFKACFIEDKQELLDLKEIIYRSAKYGIDMQFFEAKAANPKQKIKNLGSKLFEIICDMLNDSSFGIPRHGFEKLKMYAKNMKDTQQTMPNEEQVLILYLNHVLIPEVQKNLDLQSNIKEYLSTKIKLNERITIESFKVLLSQLR